LGFRPVQSHIGVSQKLVRINSDCGNRNADAGSNRDFVSIQIVGAAKSVQSARGESFRLIEGLDRGLQNYKLVTAESRNDIGVVTHGLPQARGDSRQKHIAPAVPQSVVDLFELVQINEVKSALVVGPPFAKDALHVTA